MDILKIYMTSHNISYDESYMPLIFRLAVTEDKKNLENLLGSDKSLIVIDEIDGQLRELIKSLNPQIRIKDEDYPALIETHLNGCPLQEYGAWVYYPWNKRLIHCLDEDEFIEVRTNRNRYKLSREEQQILKNKKIGIIGLSVGQSIALTLAMERTCGELRLADFDTAELSNLNRIRTGVHNLGLKKTLIAAREIAEIDPYLKVRIFSDGITAENIDIFFEGNGKLDILVEVCDGLDIKILSRFKARELGIPVVMDTNDRGMMDVERFDLEPDRPILHGLAGDLDPQKIKDLSNEQKIPYIFRMVGVDTMSTRLKASMVEVGQSINTWPQLASSVVLGGALTTDVCRRILLDQYHDSDRYYIDIDELIADKKPVIAAEKPYVNPYAPLDADTIHNITSTFLEKSKLAEYTPSAQEIDKIIDAAMLAPSLGNRQPWKWTYRQGILFLFYDRHKAWSWLDTDGKGALVSLGTALENVHLRAAELQLADTVSLYPLSGEQSLVAAVSFKRTAVEMPQADLELAPGVDKRQTNRSMGKKEPIPAGFFSHVQQLIGRYPGLQLMHIEDEPALKELGAIAGACDRIKLLNQHGHEAFYSELRWSSEEAEVSRDGIDIMSSGLSQGEIAGYTVAREWEPISLLAKWDKGNVFKLSAAGTFNFASSAVLFSLSKADEISVINAGRAIERVWIYANQQGIAVQPLHTPLSLFGKINGGNMEGLSDNAVKDLRQLNREFSKIFTMPGNLPEEMSVPVFLMKLSVADHLNTKALRKNRNEIFL